MQIEVLGPIRLSADDGSIVEVAERQLRLLLASLVAAEGEPVSASTLVDRLWDREVPANPRKVLQAKLSRLRTALDQARPGSRELLEHTPAGYRLALQPSELDAARFTGAVARARAMAPSTEKTGALTGALDLWRGEPFGDAAEEIWLQPAVTALHDARIDALEALVGALVERGDPHTALRVVGGTVEDCAARDGREGLVGSTMLALYQVGRQHEALELFERVRRRLADELGVDPSPHTRELHGRILRQDPELAVPATRPAEPVPAPDPPLRRSNLPAQAGPLIGRAHESGQLAEQVAGARLTTVTGIGGVGKTRLALHVAHEHASGFERGTWFIDLAELAAAPQDGPASAARVATLAVNALGLPDRSPQTDMFDRLSEALGSRPSLLVLDNCEHVIAEAAAFTAELLRRAPEAKVLATSREPLGLAEEQRSPLGTLPTEPAAGEDCSEAVSFFLARAQASDPHFQLDVETAEDVAELCRRLDGLPLALELAASRVRGLSVRDLLDRLSERLNLLRRPGHAAPRRQQTLRAMIDWSWSLLDGAERAVLRRLAVHPGTVGLEAAEAVCGGPVDPAVAAPAEPEQVADILAGLVDRSLVTTSRAAGAVRYGLLESIATYAAEKLADAGERDAAAHRHLTFYLALAHRANQELRGPGQRHWLPRMEAEHAQLQHAFCEAVRRCDGGAAVRMAVATFWFHWISGHHTRLGERLETAARLPGPRDDHRATAATLAAAMGLAARPDHADQQVTEELKPFQDPGARARAQWFAGTSMLASGLREAGNRHVDQAVGTLLATGQDWDAAIAASQRDWFAMTQWDAAAQGLPGGRDPAAIIRASGDGYGMSQVLAVDYCAAEARGDHREAARTAERALELCLDLSLRAEASYWFTTTAIAMLRTGDADGAADRLAEARVFASGIGDEGGVRFAGFGAAMVARYRGELRSARTLLEGWLAHAQPPPATEAAEAPANTAALFEQGFLAAQEGDPAGARDAIERLRSPVRQTARPPAIARLLELAAALHAGRGGAPYAAELLGTAAAVRARAQIEPSAPEHADLQRVQEQLAARLSDSERADAAARGRSAAPLDQLEAATGTVSAAPG